MKEVQEKTLSREDEEMVQEAILAIANSEIEGLEGQLVFIAHLISSVTDDDYRLVAQEIIHLMDRVLETPTYRRDSNQASRLRKAKKILGNPEKHKICLGCESTLSRKPSICPICHAHGYDTRTKAVLATTTRSILSPRAPKEAFDGLVS